MKGNKQHIFIKKMNLKEMKTYIIYIEFDFLKKNDEQSTTPHQDETRSGQS